MRTVIKKDRKRTNVTILWESIDEPKAASAQIKDKSAANRAARFLNGEANSDNPMGWLGAPSFAEFNERMHRGWPEGVERLMRLEAKAVEAQSVRRRRVRGDQGDEVDMQAVYRGDLSRAWTRTRRMSKVASRQVTIVCNLGASAGTSADELFWRGASTLRLTSALVEAGYNVSIYGAEAGKDSAETEGVNVAQFIEIKASDSPLDLSALASLTCMSGFFRTSLFAGILYGCDVVGAVASSGMGKAESDLRPYAEQIGLTDCIFQPEVNNEVAANVWIEDALAQIEQGNLKAA